jgi:hypothetical protein
MSVITIKSNLKSDNLNFTEYLNSQRKKNLLYFLTIFNFKKFSRGCEERVRHIEGGGSYRERLFTPTLKYPGIKNKFRSPNYMRF